MRAVVQRVDSASVEVDGKIVGKIARGFLVLVSAGHEDSEKDIAWMAKKIVNLRVFPDDEDRMNFSLKDVDGELLIVSQFTLHGTCQKGNRPSFVAAMEPVRAEAMYNDFVETLKQSISVVETGIFGAMMKVSLTNDGPVTLLIDSHKKF